MEDSTETKSISGRRYELDWLRVFGILALMFFHTGRIFDTGDWHIKNNEVSQNFDYWMPFLHSWRMPLLLFISGAGSYFAFKSTLPFLSQRFKRLMVPFAFGLIVVLPPQVYFQYITSFHDYWDVFRSFGEYIPFHEGRANLFHLWFLLYLFLYSITALPLIIYLHSSQSKIFKDKFLRYFFNPIVLLFVPPVFISLTQLMLLPDHHVRAFFVYYLCFFLFGMVFYSSSNHRDSIGRNRMYFLIASLLILVPFVLIYVSIGTVFSQEYLPIGSGLSYVSIFVGWFWIITFVSYGQHYLNRHHPWLVKLSDGIISFYTLHQTVIVVIGYYVCRLPWSIAAKFWSINSLTLVFCVSFYVVCVRPFNVMRILFGMKVKNAPSSLSPIIQHQSAS